MGGRQLPLSFGQLRVVDVSRCRRWHPGFPNDHAWDGDDWLNAVLGEVGETANEIKKLHRLDVGLPGALDGQRAEVLAHIGEELADVVCYVDLCCAFHGWSLAEPETPIQAFTSTAGPTSLSLAMGVQIGRAIEGTRTLACLQRLVATCAALAGTLGIDLADAVARKFNTVSERQGFPERLPTTSEAADPYRAAGEQRAILQAERAGRK